MGKKRGKNVRGRRQHKRHVTVQCDPVFLLKIGLRDNDIITIITIIIATRVGGRRVEGGKGGTGNSRYDEI